MLADGFRPKDIGAQLGVGRLTIPKWRERYLDGGIDALWDRPRPGQPKKLSAEREKELWERTTQTLPEQSISWSLRTLAREEGVTEYQIRSLWSRRAHDPYRIQNTIDFALTWLRKRATPVGICFAPPYSVLVLRVESQGTQPSPNLSTMHEALRSLKRRRVDREGTYRVLDAVGHDGSPSRATSVREVLMSSGSWRPGHAFIATTESAEIIGPTDPSSMHVVKSVDAWLAGVETVLCSCESGQLGLDAENRAARIKSQARGLNGEEAGRRALCWVQDDPRAATSAGRFESPETTAAAIS